MSKEFDSEKLKALYENHLAKTAVRCLIWWFLGFVITHYYPDLSWVWYVVVVFILIAILFSLWVMFMRFMAGKRSA